MKRVTASLHPIGLTINHVSKLYETKNSCLQLCNHISINDQIFQWCILIKLDILWTMLNMCTGQEMWFFTKCVICSLNFNYFTPDLKVTSPTIAFCQLINQGRKEAPSPDLCHKIRYLRKPDRLFCWVALRWKQMDGILIQIVPECIMMTRWIKCSTLLPDMMMLLCCLMSWNYTLTDKLLTELRHTRCHLLSNMRQTMWEIIPYMAHCTMFVRSFQKCEIKTANVQECAPSKNTQKSVYGKFDVHAYIH